MFGFGSNIILALLGTGEAYLVDQRKEHRGRFELCEVQDDSDDEGQSSKTRYVPFTPSSSIAMTK
jgi:COMPASS component SWD1